MQWMAQHHRLKDKLSAGNNIRSNYTNFQKPPTQLFFRFFITEALGTDPQWMK